MVPPTTPMAYIILITSGIASADAHGHESWNPVSYSLGAPLYLVQEICREFTWHSFINDILPSNT
jgi:hypothetical protein